MSDATSGTEPETTGLDDTAQAEKILRFWETARVRVNRNTVGGVIGETTATTVAPQAWSFGDSPELADELLQLVLDGTKTATAELVSEFERAGEPVPAKGDLSIVLDGAGDPRLLIRTTRVDVVPFAEVTAEHAHLEGEDDRTLETWREGHERYWRRQLEAVGDEFDPSMPVVCERFEVLYGA
ncbi:ASCH domain-containing protein [Isoptericola variabilis]|uniref:ASCH domain protein n=1 Tax=Isoptericola variabilis (strain 225) TaxID=743718 RepID=F6FQK5_ISOV2|nr:ASCH domain-containing protein [Isoptericola variabilis]AEG44901.1 ASCH domain protein [Isoptericola variabilis 225]TWH28734.1 uncharacterized protein YhfF [Isoptericola variabilis J7]